MKSYLTESLMRLIAVLILISLFSVSCGKNQVTIEIRGGDGNLVRLDANDVQYKFNKQDSFIQNHSYARVF